MPDFYAHTFHWPGISDTDIELYFPDEMAWEMGSYFNRYFGELLLLAAKSRKELRRLAEIKTTLNYRERSALSKLYFLVSGDSPQTDEEANLLVEIRKTKFPVAFRLFSPSEVQELNENFEAMRVAEVQRVFSEICSALQSSEQEDLKKMANYHTQSSYCLKSSFEQWIRLVKEAATRQQGICTECF